MEAMIRRAAQRLLEGGLVAFPTETVYGLGADAENVEAIARIYAAKGRPANHPVIVHLPPGADIEYWAAQVPPQARLLIDAFWPGPLTLILPRTEHIPAAVAGGQSSIGLRCPAHPVAQDLLKSFAKLKGGHGGVAAPSANLFGQVSPTQADHVRAEFSNMSDDDLLILEGGASEVGIESTIVDLSRLEQGVGPAILRPGHITAVQIGEVLGVSPDTLVQAHSGKDASRRKSLEPGRENTPAQAPRVSGSLKAHYAPRTPLQVLPRHELLALLNDASAAQKPLACIVFEPLDELGAVLPGVEWFVAQAEPHAYARELYALLRRLDQGGYSRLVFERPPGTPAWRAINDRLGRAAAAFDS
ncbi:L-threonylcarbamoyladenylate synthase [Pusillimonas sp.]|uniref:L-threonylcarbamoyladenylate synthase n=1 Tax=Pusillimonas sp. TaxID=3040095 RepID=UPI0037C860A2